MDRSELTTWLRETDAERLTALWRRADAMRREHVGDAVHLRGLIEFSNRCVRQCLYCGLRAGNSGLRRYRMNADEIMACVRQAVAFGYGTVVLQSGEDYGVETEWMSALIRRIKSETPLAVTLSLGERPESDLAAWRDAGADRYLLRFETSNTALFRRIHPPAGNEGPPPTTHRLPPTAHPRIAILYQLRALGYEVGSGVMIGIPGQTYEDLADDLELFRALDLDMIGVGPFIPHPATPLGRSAKGPKKGTFLISAKHPLGRLGREMRNVPFFGPRRERVEVRGDWTEDQAPNSELMTCKVVALTRLVCPRANIPSTTALATLNRADGRELGLQRGANVVMPNLTPPPYRAAYEIYPAKACLFETADECHAGLARRIRSIGRTIGVGPGAARRAQTAPTPAPALAPGERLAHA
jgi:biotin synthase